MTKILILILLLSSLVLTGCEVTDTTGVEFIDYNKPQDTFEFITNESDIDEQAAYQINETTLAIKMTKQDVFSVGAWNIQIFGKTKMQNIPVMNGIEDVIRDYDIIAIQEIRDISGSVINRLEDINGYDIIYSERLGRSKSKEQYAILYRPSVAQVLGVTTYPDEDDVFEREPYLAHMQLGNYSFVMIVIHVKPLDAVNEINYLEDVMKYGRTYFGDADVFIMGDLNMDCSYHNGVAMEQYQWLINESVDTTVGASNCAYDRVVAMNNNNWECDVDEFDGKSDDLIVALSDHYVARCEVKI